MTRLNLKKSASETLPLIGEIEKLYLRNRQSGTSEAIRKLSEQMDILVICSDKQSAKRFGKAGIAFSELDRVRGDIKPILIDNQAVLDIIMRVSKFNSIVYERMQSAEDKLSFVREIVGNGISKKL